MEATGKSFSSVKKWRLKVEELSGHEFKQTKMRVSRRRVQKVYQFTKEEFDKFLKLSKRINETNNLAQSVVDIWGDLKARRERQLYKDVFALKNVVEGLKTASKNKDVTISVLTGRVKRLEERLEGLEENQGKGFFSKIKKKEKRGI